MYAWTPRRSSLELSRLGFGDYDGKSSFKSPPGYRAPTWSWASLDGMVEYPMGRLGYIDAEVEGFTVVGAEGASSPTLPSRLAS
jgi:hypothetical protein